MTMRRWLMLALGAAAVLLLVGRALAGAYADYLWYDALGAVSLWRARIVAMTWLRVGCAVVAGLFAFANLYTVRRSVVSLVFPRRVGNLEIGEEVPGRYLMGAAIGLSIVLGVLLGASQGGGDWISAILARSGRMFNETDPYFGADLGFFVYWLPFETDLWTWTFYTVIVISIAVVLLYALTPSLKWHRGSIYASTYVRRHLTVLVGILLLMLAWSFRLDMYSLLVDGSGPEGMFSYVDHHIGVPGDLLLSLTTLGAALIVMWAGVAGQFRLAGISVLSVVVLGLSIREIAPAVVQHTGGGDAERAARERPYIATRAGYTRRAFAADAVIRADSSTGYPSLANALPWVPIWDPPALVRALDVTGAGAPPTGGGGGSPGPSAPGEGGSGTDASTARVGWQTSPIGLVAEIVAPPPQGASVRAPWTAARVLASDADDRGAPMRVAPALSNGEVPAAVDGPAADAVPIDPPVIFPDASPYSIVPDSLNHTTGTSLESFFTRLAIAWSLQNFRILTADLPQPRPTIISRRDVHDRIALYAPFFAQGHSVEPLLLGDSLYWAVDLYSVSDSYPLSRHTLIVGQDRSYFHHAAVAIVHSSTGETVVVPDSGLDPIAATWVRQLPGMFGTWSALPPGLPALLQPPIDGIYAQANAFGRYGSRTDSEVERHVPSIDGADTALTTDDLPIVLPSGETALTLPLVDDTDRLRGLLIGTGGAGRSTAWYPLAAPGSRWSAVLDRLRSVDSAGSAAREGPLAHGRVRVVPIRSAGRVGFLQPTYRWRPPSIPTLNRIALLAGDTVRSIIPPTGVALRAMQLQAGGRRGRQTAAVGGRQAGGGAFKAAVAALYTAMRDALRRGDWTAFGRAFDALGRAVAGRGGRP